MSELSEDQQLLARVLLERVDEGGDMLLPELRRAFFSAVADKNEGNNPEGQLMQALNALESQGAVSRWIDHLTQQVVVSVDRSRLISLSATPGPRGRISDLSD